MLRSAILLGFVAVSGCGLAIPDFRGGGSTPVAQPMPEPPAPTVNPLSAKERFIASAADNGCVVNSQTSAAIMAGATLSADDMGQIMQSLVAEGRGEIAADQQSFRVTTGACTA